jgi:hypothetical protein
MHNQARGIVSRDSLLNWFSASLEGLQRPSGQYIVTNYWRGCRCALTMAEKHDRFATRILEEPKLFVIGDENEFGKLIARP